MKRLAFVLGIAGATLVTYATVRAGSRHRSNMGARQDMYQESNAVYMTGSTSMIARFDASDSSAAKDNGKGGEKNQIAVESNRLRLPVEFSLRKLQSCFNSDIPCDGFATSSLHDYQVDILTQMQAAVETEYLATLQDPSIRTEAHEIFARELLRNSQPELQVYGIKFLEFFAPSQENLDALSTCLSRTLSEELFEQGMDLIKDKYKGRPDFDEEVRQMLGQQIQFGIDETTSHRAAQELYQYLDRTSYHYFVSIDAKLRPLADRHAALNSTLSEYAAAHHMQ